VIRIRLLLADDHPVVRAGLESLLAAEPDLMIVGRAASGRAAAALCMDLRPAVALVDLRMPDGGGWEVLDTVRRERLETRVVVLSTWDGAAEVQRALAGGAHGYLSKDTPAEELLGAIRAVARGARVVGAAATRAVEGGGRTLRSLSARELEVLGYLARGASNAVIARALFVSEATVKTHLVHAFDKLGVHGRTAAVTRALELGLVRLDAP
jgi:DNA-binding NarL/FixJ family response regulator